MTGIRADMDGGDPVRLAAVAASDDADLADVRVAARGDVRAFERLYQRHANRIHGVVWRLAGGVQARAEELVQDTFVRAWQRLDSFRGDSRFSTWLHRLAVNTALMDLRAGRSRPEGRLDPDSDDWDGGHEESPGLRLDLERAVASLPPRARAVLVLHDIEGWQHQEIGSELGMAVGTSKAQLHRARALLRKRLEVTS
jgi:RNA polymerase sigma factor (sigma-70 family)